MVHIPLCVTRFIFVHVSYVAFDLPFSGDCFETLAERVTEGHVFRAPNERFLGSYTREHPGI